MKPVYDPVIADMKKTAIEFYQYDRTQVKEKFKVGSDYRIQQLKFIAKELRKKKAELKKLEGLKWVKK